MLKNWHHLDLQAFEGLSEIKKNHKNTHHYDYIISIDCNNEVYYNYSCPNINNLKFHQWCWTGYKACITSIWIALFLWLGTSKFLWDFENKDLDVVSYLY